MIDYLRHIAINTEKLVAALEAAGPTAQVPTCPEWSVADLGYHLFEVQAFWATIVKEQRSSPEGIESPARPDEARIPTALRDAGERLVAALAAADPGATTWTWTGEQPVAWVQRRQAHEALIHRVDGERAAMLTSEADADLAADGVQELVDWFWGTAPDWVTFTPARGIAIIRTDGPGEWRLSEGRFVGTSPASGDEYDMVTVLAGGDQPPAVQIRGSAAALDLWLWGRGDIGALEIEGDRSLADFLREDLVGITQ